MTDYLKETIETYDTHAEAFEASRAAYAQHDLIEQFRDDLQGSQILEMGCGPGRDARIFVDAGYTVTGIDLSRSLLDIAKAKVPEATFHLMDATALSFEDQSFDGVWANALFVHFRHIDISRALHEAFRVLRPGGVLRFSVKKGSGEKEKQDRRLGNSKQFMVYHSPEAMEKVTQEVGFEILRMYQKDFETSRGVTTWIDVFAKKPL